MLAKAILVHGVIGYKFCWLLPSEDQNQGTPAGHESAETPIGNVSKGFFTLQILYKMVKWPGGLFIFKGYRTKEHSELVHSNMFGPFGVYGWKVWVFHHFTNKYSRFRYVHKKSNALNTFIEFKAGSKNLLGKHICYFD